MHLHPQEVDYYTGGEDPKLSLSASLIITGIAIYSPVGPPSQVVIKKIHCVTQSAHGEPHEIYSLLADLIRE